LTLLRFFLHVELKFLAQRCFLLSAMCQRSQLAKKEFIAPPD
jgi:hypothetical protein